MKRQLLIVLIALTLLHGGCHSAPPQSVVIEYRPGCKAQTFQVPVTATYELRSVTADGRESPVIGQREVRKQIHLGFVRQFDGTLTAYAGGETIVLPEGSYIWVMVPGSTRTPDPVDDENDERVHGKAVAVLGKVMAATGKVAAGMLYAFFKAGH